MDAKQKLIEIAGITDSKLRDYWLGEIETRFGFNQRQKELVENMLCHAEEHNLRSAKRLRASFVIMGYLLGQKEIGEDIWEPAMAAELVHTALLMHDDFMDEDNLRRGLPTTHKYFEGSDAHYGESMAVDLGDAVLLMGYELLLKSNFKDSLKIKATRQFLRGVTNTAWGQAYDLSLGKMKQWVEDDVISLHKAKTAIYTYENPLFIGAILGGLGKEVLAVLHDYSMDGGVAFQLQDDILGVFGDSEKTGKSDNSDLLQGKCTLLIIKTLELGSEEQKKNLMRVWGKRKAEKEDITLAKQAIIDSGSLEYSRMISKNYARLAAITAEKLYNLNLNNEAVDYIKGIAEYMVNRDV